MSESDHAAPKMPTAQFAEMVAEALSDIQQHILANATQSLNQGPGQIDANVVLRQLAQDYARDPQRWQQLQQTWYQQQWALWTSTAAAATAPGVPQPPSIHDRRFRGSEWHEPYFRWLSQSYLITSQWLDAVAGGVELEAHEKRRAEFLVHQWIDAASPANFVWSNPEALKLAAATQGESLAQGLQNLRADLPKGMVSMTDDSAFEIGVNIATTPGAVVFENDVLQLIQYRPITETVHAYPLLMVPPCINKYYILDLQADNSLARYAVEQGHTTFMVSWRNIPPELGTLTWDDYVASLIAAIEAMRDICGVKKVNGLAFCVGGTLLACALAVLKRKRQNPAASVALLATMLDFCDTGELSVFIDEAYVERREREFADGGILEGRELAVTFAMLRPNDLIWNYVVNNYLKGKTPPAFDLLYWNCDSTNLPGAMYAWYIRHTYLENSLRLPGKVKVCGTPLDLSKLDLPIYLLATREDHIVPWKTAYAGTQLLNRNKSNLTFVLSASGHIAGIVNPASRDRRNYWLNEHIGPDAEAWLAGATSVQGSWWKHWSAWAAPHGGGPVPARTQLGSKAYPVIEAAPGRYVHAKAPPAAAVQP